MIEYINEHHGYMLRGIEHDINPINNFGVECGKGWHPLIKEMIDIISKLDIRKEVNIFQIKEKFGQFRFYYNITKVTNKYIEEVVSDFEIKINNTCEICSAPGKIHKKTRLQTLCDVCYNKD